MPSEMVAGGKLLAFGCSKTVGWLVESASFRFLAPSSWMIGSAEVLIHAQLPPLLSVGRTCGDERAAVVKKAHWHKERISRGGIGGFSHKKSARVGGRSKEWELGFGAQHHFFPSDHHFYCPKLKLVSKLNCTL